LLLVVGGGLTLGFSTSTALSTCVIVLGFIGVGMGFVTMATLLIVQDSLDASDLGVATASHQFFRTLGGTVGVGVSGSFVTAALAASMDSLLNSESNNLSPSLSNQVIQNVENLFRPEVQALLTPEVQETLQQAVAQGVSLVFWIAVFASLTCLLLSLILPKDTLSETNRGS
jgi:hypothetical protein